MEHFAKKIIERSILDVWQKYCKMYGRNILSFKHRYLTGLLIPFFEIYKGLVTIILRERKNLQVALWNIYCCFIGPLNFKVYH